MTNNSLDFDNVYIYVSDALRFADIATKLDGYNKIRTVASSTMSCSSFPTIVSGLYPPQHGVDSFNKRINSSIETIFDLFEPNKCLCYHSKTVANHKNAVHFGNITKFKERLKSIDSQFFALDREPITHAPYGFDVTGTEYADADLKFNSDKEYWTERKNSPEKIRQDYKRSVKISIEKFKERINILRERGILDSTLVIFTADHGELVGEYGLYGHGNYLSLETVYVPTIFYNEQIVIEDPVIGLIDLYPTIADLLGKSVPDNRPGKSLVNSKEESRIIYSDSSYVNNNITQFSAWGANGGYVFSEDDFQIHIKDIIGELTTRGSTAKLQRRSPIQSIKSLLGRMKMQEFGKPEFTVSEGYKFASNIYNNSRSSETKELTQEAKERLTKLGYIGYDE